MVKVVSILLTTAIVILIEKQNLSESWKKKEKIVFFTLLFIGTGLTIVWSFQMPLYNPLDLIATVYKPISQPITNYLNQFTE